MSVIFVDLHSSLYANWIFPNIVSDFRLNILFSSFTSSRKCQKLPDLPFLAQAPLTIVSLWLLAIVLYSLWVLWSSSGLKFYNASVGLRQLRRWENGKTLQTVGEKEQGINKSSKWVPGEWYNEMQVPVASRTTIPNAESLGQEEEWHEV